MKNSTKYASNKKIRAWSITFYGGFRGSVGMGIPWGFPRDFSVGMGWVWGLISNPHGSPELCTWVVNCADVRAAVNVVFAR